ncbi:MAG: heterodisulfide reductase-related iron-sulfur binding cluster [Halobacteriota archaeon]|nr:heterodisulfide reductase-related iron-sulfur binding cluster [Halobacteriota archaeon]
MIPNKAIFFEGCTMSRRMVGLRFATRFLLDKYGIEWEVLPNIGCCGAPVMRSGDYELGIKQRDKVFKATLRAGHDTIITACPGCGSMLKEAGEKEGIEVLHIDELLEALAKEGKLYRPGEMRDFNMTATAHFPCHMNRGMKIDCDELFPAVLSAFPNMKYVRMEGAEKCCGAGGGVRASQVDLAYKIAEKKVKNAVDSNADVLIATCPFCELHLNDSQKKFGANLAVVALPMFVALSFYDFEDAVKELGAVETIEEEVQ